MALDLAYYYRELKMDLKAEKQVASTAIGLSE